MKELLCVLTVYDFIVVSSLEQLIVLLVRRISIQKDVWVMKDHVLLFTVTSFTGCIQGYNGIIIQKTQYIFASYVFFAYNEI